MERSTVVLDPTSLRALAHPLRVQLLGLLRADGPSTATALGARTGESSGTTSYHLRQLAGAGLVADETGRGNGRERWWRAAQDSTRLDAAGWADEDLPAVRAYMGAVATTYARKVAEYLAEEGTYPKRWQRASTLSDWSLPLTAAELIRLNEEVEALIESYRRPERKGDEQVVLQVQAFPRRRRRATP
ncbi:MAG: helix-turn-helix domain-containing protein [Actinobacteria bacterium]|nr:helix-turn-helix domain-containing protein [Actinomycetota bacterium]MCA1721445.1 helix-turn-helix domain-containing protein [Actinomycetota bacterium]